MFTEPIPGTITRVSFKAVKLSLATLKGLVFTIVVIPLAKNIPARVTIKGWISRYATRKPCTIPKARPMATASNMDTNTLPPPKSRYTAQLMLTSATTPPTEISIPPVIMTKLMPQDRMISAALAFRMLKNV